MRLKTAEDVAVAIRRLAIRGAPILEAEGIPVQVLPDAAAPALISRGEVDAIFVGADRIASNGDFANKIGTYSLALAAKAHGVPFYCAAPMSTFDLSLLDGSYIPIEERASDEVLSLGETRLVTPGLEARNPAFDVTPGALVTAFLTDRGVLRAPRNRSIKELAADCRS